MRGARLFPVVSRALTSAAAGLVSALVYLVLTVKMSFIEHFPGPGITVDFVKMLGPDWGRNTALLLGAYALLFICFGVILRVAKAGTDELVRRMLFGFPVAFAVILAFMYPPHAVDFIHNVADARTLWLFWDNPMVVAPDVNAFPVGQSYGGEPAPYGPLWFLLLFPVKLAGSQLQPELHLLKLYTSGFYLASAALVYLMARRLSPDRATFATCLYAWNPFIVMRVAGNGHNDVVMLFFLLLALWALFDGRSFVWVLPALTAAVLVKYVAALLVPIVLLAGLYRAADRRAFLRQAAAGAALSLVLTAVVFAPLWSGPDTFDAVREQAGKFITSTPLLLREWFKTEASLAEDEAGSLASLIGTSTFALTYLVLLVAGWRARFTPIAIIVCAALVLLAFNLFAVTWFRPWYMLWPLTLLVLVPGRWTTWLVIAISAGGMLPDLLEQYRGNIGFLRDHYLWAVAAPVIAAFLPPVAIWATGAVREGSVLLLGSRKPAARGASD